VAVAEFSREAWGSLKCKNIAPWPEERSKEEPAQAGLEGSRTETLEATSVSSLRCATQPDFIFTTCATTMTPEQEKALHDALDRLAGKLARGRLGSGEKQVRPWLKLGEATMSRTQQFLGSSAAFVRAPGGCERRTTPGALWSQQAFPDPRWTGPKIL